MLWNALLVPPKDKPRGWGGDTEEIDPSRLAWKRISPQNASFSPNRHNPRKLLHPSWWESTLFSTLCASFDQHISLIPACEILYPAASLSWLNYLCRILKPSGWLMMFCCKCIQFLLLSLVPHFGCCIPSKTSQLSHQPKIIFLIMFETQAD